MNTLICRAIRLITAPLLATAISVNNTQAQSKIDACSLYCESIADRYLRECGSQNANGCQSLASEQLTNCKKEKCETVVVVPPVDILRHMAGNYVEEEFGKGYTDFETIPVFLNSVSIRGYLFIFQKDGAFSSKKQVLEKLKNESAASLFDKSFASIEMSATLDKPPVIVSWDGLPPHYIFSEQSQSTLQKKYGKGTYKLSKLYASAAYPIIEYELNTEHFYYSVILDKYSNKPFVHKPRNAVSLGSILKRQEILDIWRKHIARYGKNASKASHGSSLTLSVSAPTCPSSNKKNIINEGLEYPDGVPNYNMADFPGPNDCGPTSSAMLFGYWDANGWNCFMEGSPYYRDSGGFETGAMEDVHEKVAIAWDWSSSTGSWEWDTGSPLLVGEMGESLVDVAKALDSAASGWGSNDDENVSQDEIRGEIDAGHAMLLLVKLFTSIDYTWVNDTGSDDSVRTHWMTVLGYRDRKDYTHVNYLFGSECVDWMNADEFYVMMRSAWRSGGDSYLRYHWYALDDLYTVSVRETGSSSCTDYIDNDGDSFAASTALPGTTPGGDCNDADSGINPGTTDKCSDNIDNDCNGIIDDLVDTDSDGICNIEDTDDDGDGVADVADSCPLNPSPDCIQLKDKARKLYKGRIDDFLKGEVVICEGGVCYKRVSPIDPSGPRPSPDELLIRHQVGTSSAPIPSPIPAP